MLICIKSKNNKQISMEIRYLDEVKDESTETNPSCNKWQT